MDTKRRKTCLERYGVESVVAQPHVAKRGAALANTPEAQAKKRATRRKTLQDLSVVLTRGLSIPRSRAEISFFEHLHAFLGHEIECPKYVNGWWVDGYVPAFDSWIQFDGVYWHSNEIAKKKDIDQDVWFAFTGKRLIRITDKEFAAKGFSLEAWCMKNGLSPVLHPSS